MEKIMSDTKPFIPSFSSPKNEIQESSNKQQKKPPAKYWLNVGVKVGDTMLTLPQGIALDNLEPKAIPNKTSDFQKVRIKEQALFEQFMEWVHTNLKPGEAKMVQLQCEVRMVNEREEPSEEDTGIQFKFA